MTGAPHTRENLLHTRENLLHTRENLTRTLLTRALLRLI